MIQLNDIVFQSKVKLNELSTLRPSRSKYTDYFNTMAERHCYSVPGRTGSLLEILKKSPDVPFALSHRCPRKLVLFYN